MRFNIVTTVHRHVPAEPAQVYAALIAVATAAFKLTSADEATMACAFNSRISAFTWGEVFRAEVLPSDGGSIIMVSGMGKIPWQIAQRSRNTVLINGLLDDILTRLRRPTSV